MLIKPKNVNQTKIRGKFIKFAEIGGEINKFCGNRGNKQYSSLD